MLDAARAKAPDVAWVRADLATVGPADLPEGAPAAFDAVVMAGNVMIFVQPGSEGAVLERLHALVVPDGLLVAGFQLRTDRVGLDEYDRLAAAAGLELIARWATWERDAFSGGDYAVSVHRRAR
jgi:hypothetical protein